MEPFQAEHHLNHHFLAIRRNNTGIAKSKLFLAMLKPVMRQGSGNDIN
jgi:hypothetical protein